MLIAFLVNGVGVLHAFKASTRSLARRQVLGYSAGLSSLPDEVETGQRLLASSVDYSGGRNFLMRSLSASSLLATNKCSVALSLEFKRLLGNPCVLRGTGMSSEGLRPWRDVLYDRAQRGLSAQTRELIYILTRGGDRSAIRRRIRRNSFRIPPLSSSRPAQYWQARAAGNGGC